MAVSDADILGWLNANPGASDALIAQTMQEAGVSPDRMAQVTNTDVGAIQARYDAALSPAAAAPTYTNTDEQGNPVYDYYAQQFAPDVVTPPPTPAPPPPAAKAAAPASTAKLTPEEIITKQILAQNLTSKWSGEGQGSAEANAKDMAKIIAATGATSIKDFGKVPVLAPVQEIGQFYNGAYVAKADLGDGVTRNVVYQGTGQYDYDGNEIQKLVEVPKDAKLTTQYGRDNGMGELEAIDQSKIKTVNGQLVADTGQTTFGNVKTGQAVGNTYSERQTGDFFGGTFAGKGNTGYGVKFADNGMPIFYTAGASSNDFAQLMQDLGPLGNIALTAIGGPMAVAAMGVLSGKKPEDILKSAALSYLGGQAGSFVSGMEGITDVLGDYGTNLAANATKQFVGSGGKGIDATKLLLGSGLPFGSSGVDGPSSADFEEGYFSPGGEGFSVLNSDSTDDFLRSIGINSVDELTDSGLSNADILSLVNGDYGDLSGLEGLASVDDDFSSTYVDGAGTDVTLPSVDEDFPSTYTNVTDDEIYSILNSGNIGSITSLLQSLTGGTGGTGGTRTGGTGTTTTTGGTGTTTGGTGTTTTTGGTGTTTGGTTTGTTTTGGTTTGSTTTTGTTTTKPTVTTTKPTVTTTKPTVPKTSTGTNVAKALAGLVTGAKTAGTGAKTALPATAKTAGATSTNPVVDAITSMADQQQNQQTNLLNVMGGKDQLANIKSYKDLYGQDLFGDNYVPPSALGLEGDDEIPQGAGQESYEDEYANGGHINDLSVDALLHILRN